MGYIKWMLVVAISLASDHGVYAAGGLVWISAGNLVYLDHNSNEYRRFNVIDTSHETVFKVIPAESGLYAVTGYPKGKKVLARIKYIDTSALHNNTGRYQTLGVSRMGGFSPYIYKQKLLFPSKSTISGSGSYVLIADSTVLDTFQLNIIEPIPQQFTFFITVTPDDSAALDKAIKNYNSSDDSNAMNRNNQSSPYIDQLSHSSFSVMYSPTNIDTFDFHLGRNNAIRSVEEVVVQAINGISNMVCGIVVVDVTLHRLNVTQQSKNEHENYLVVYNATKRSYITLSYPKDTWHGWSIALVE